MAKRENFKISYNGQEVIKHAWNSANREVEAIIREIARQEGVIYYLQDKESVKEDRYSFVRGHRTWATSAGKTIRFDIEKV